MTRKVNQEPNWINWILWAIYLMLLAVLLPHTAWWFARSQPDEISTMFGLQVNQGLLTAWFAAFVFEGVIAVLTHKLASHIKQVPKYASQLKRLSGRYVNAYGIGLMLAWGISTYANLAHSVEFGRPLKIFSQWNLPDWTYSLASGAILPTASLLFAWVLSSVIEQDASEAEANPELVQAKKTIAQLKQQLHQTEQEIGAYEQRAVEAEARFRAAGDLIVRLFDGPKRQRILAANEQWPRLKPSAIAVITETSPGYVSDVLNGANDDH